MNIFQLFPIDRWGEKFAGATIAVDVPWVDPDEVCSKCYWPVHRRRTGPFAIAWESGSDIISDFLFPSASYDMIVTNRVKKIWEESTITGFTPWEVLVRGNKKPASKYKYPIVPTPYKGPRLWDIYVTGKCNIIAEDSTVEFEGYCSKCKTPMYEPIGESGDQLFVVDPLTWNGADFMLPCEVSALFVTERVTEIVQKHRFTNVRIVPVGHIDS